MKILTPCFVVACGLAFLGGCNSSNSAHRDEQKETPGEKAGRAAYEAQKDLKKAGKEITQDLKDFRRDARAGYDEAKQKHEEKKAADPKQ
jgi:hypothetical protein